MPWCSVFRFLKLTVIAKQVKTPQGTSTQGHVHAAFSLTQDHTTRLNPPRQPLTLQQSQGSDSKPTKHLAPHFPFKSWNHVLLKTVLIFSRWYRGQRYCQTLYNLVKGGHKSDSGLEGVGHILLCVCGHAACACVHMALELAPRASHLPLGFFPGDWGKRMRRSRPEEFKSSLGSLIRFRLKSTIIKGSLGHN